MQSNAFERIVNEFGPAVYHTALAKTYSPRATVYIPAELNCAS